MNEPFDNPRPDPIGDDPEALRKRRLWRNLFLLNLCISILLVGIFWLPQKLVQLEEFANSPSVNLPQTGETEKIKMPEPIQAYKNQLPLRFAVVNASSDKDWAYFDFSRGTQVKIHDPTSLEWDLAFRRGKVISNGGATNKFGKAGIVDLGDVQFETLLKVPQQNYVQDISTRTETENPVLLKWYKYNYLTHKLTAKRNVYALRTSDNKYAKVQFLSFYCDNKETGCIKMRYVYQKNGSNSFLKNPGSFSGTASPAPQPSQS